MGDVPKGFVFHDLKKEGVAAILADARMFQKFVKVQVRVAQEGEVIVTKLKGADYPEKTHTCKQGDVVVTNPSGEEYVPSSLQWLEKRYRRVSVNDDTVTGTWQAFGFIRAVQNPWNVKVAIDDPWNAGKYMLGESDCMLVTPATPEGEVPNPDDMYIIGIEEFAETYR